MNRGKEERERTGKRGEKEEEGNERYKQRSEGKEGSDIKRLKGGEGESRGSAYGDREIGVKGRKGEGKK